MNLESAATGRDISYWADKLSDDFDQATTHFSNEMELREHVHHNIVSALTDLYDLGLTATSGEFNTKKAGTRSPLDRLYGGVAVEWEWDMKGARKEHGAQQALTYLANIRADHPEIGAFTAIVADGKQWGFLKYDPETEVEDLFSEPKPAHAADHFVWVENSPSALRQFLQLIGDHSKSPITSRNLASRFGPNGEVAGKLVTVLGQSMAGRLPSDRTDTLYKEWRRALDVVYGDLDKNDSALATEVQTSYRLPVARPLGELLFVLHTYFALVGRVIAVELLAVAAEVPEQAPSSWRGLKNDQLLSELRGLEAGRLPGDLDISNLFEADLFSWWADHSESNKDLLDAIRELLENVSQLAFPKIAFGPQRGGDVLRDLYQALIPNKLRKALGEFLTPYWLAEACLVRLREQGADLANGRILDPTCGTGTFIVPILAERLARLTKEKGASTTAEDVQGVLDSVTGIDLNPVAVTATRVNFAIALGELARLGSLTLPVWRADSLVVPEAAPDQIEFSPLAGIRYSQLATSLSEPFAIPGSMTSANRVAILRDLIENSIIKPEFTPPTDEEIARAKEEFKDAFAAAFDLKGPHALPSPEYYFPDEAKVASFLFNQVMTLSIDGRNGVWARLIENAYAPLFAGKFDVVVGNPPWLTWTKLPEAWRNQSEPLWRRNGLWFTPEEDGDSFSIGSGDIATLVFGVSIERYARENAVIGLLTPAALINADPGGRAFRQFHLRPAERDRASHAGVDVAFKALWVDDWSKMHPFAPDAANNPIFLIVKRNHTQLPETSGAVWTRTHKARISKGSWRQTRAVLKESVGVFAPIDPNTPTSAWRFQDAAKPALIVGGTNKYTFGKGLDTRGANGVYFVKISRPRSASGTKTATVDVENIPSEGRNKKVPPLRNQVESELVYPLLRGKDVRHWVAKPETYFVLPHQPDALDKPLTPEGFKQFPSALTWLRRHREVLELRKAPPNRNWQMSGNDWCRVDGALQYMHADHVVVVREFSSRPAAALVEPRTDYDLGGRNVSPLIDHKLMLCSVPSHEEALYLVAMINSTPMQDLLESFVNEISVSPKSLKRLPIPDFVMDAPTTKSLVDLAQQVVVADDPEEKAADLRAQMDAAVLKILTISDGYRPQPGKIKRPKRTRPISEERPVLF